MLRVGPESAGAEPGPICFGRGTKATVTDANFLLGRLDAESFLGGGVKLDRARTEKLLDEQKGALKSVQQFAVGILRVVETEMEKAIRLISIERGHDPREFTLLAFGGGGPLHACSLARALRIPTVLIPAAPGALSAVGILLADTVRDYSRTVMLPASAVSSLDEQFAELEERGQAEFATEGLDGVAQRSIDARYRGQGYELNVAWNASAAERSLDAFHALHKQNYGFCDAARPVEIVNLRLRMTAKGEAYEPVQQEPVPGDGRAAFCSEREMFFTDRWVLSRVYERDGLVAGDVIYGPALIIEYTSATLLWPGDLACVDGFTNLIVTVASGENA